MQGFEDVPYDASISYQTRGPIGFDFDLIYDQGEFETQPFAEGS